MSTASTEVSHSARSDQDFALIGKMTKVQYSDGLNSVFDKLFTFCESLVEQDRTLPKYQQRTRLDKNLEQLADLFKSVDQDDTGIVLGH